MFTWFYKAFDMFLLVIIIFFEKKLNI